MVMTSGKSTIQSSMDTSKTSDIAAHYDYVDRLMEWSLSDLEHLILILQLRITAEQEYVNALLKIKQLPPAPTIDVLPFDGESTFMTAKAKLRANLDRTISERTHLIETMSSQHEVLSILRVEQEKKKQRIKRALGRINTDYALRKSMVLSELRKTYVAKCSELEQEENSNNTAIAAAATMANDDGMIISSPESPTMSTAKADKRKSRASLHTFRHHLSSKMPITDHNKIAKLKHEVMEADRSYRNNVVMLERLREDQIKTVEVVHSNIEVMFMDKTEITKSVLRYMCITEQSILAREASALQALNKICDEMDGRKDRLAFARRMDKLDFHPPPPIYYEHYKHGLLKDAQFGISLQMYSKTHGDRAVPVLVSRCIEAVEEMGGLHREGIYRISGRHASVDALRLEFEKDEQLCDLKQFDLPTVSSVLKVYLRELECPLWAFPLDLRDSYSRKDDATRLRELETRIGNLSLPHRETLRVIIEHLARIVSQADRNKMTIHNISVIFTPAIFHDEQQSQSGPDKVLVDLINHHESLFAKYDANEQGADTLTPASTAKSSSVMPEDMPVPKPTQPAGSSIPQEATSTAIAPPVGGNQLNS